MEREYLILKADVANTSVQSKVLELLESNGLKVVMSSQISLSNKHLKEYFDHSVGFNYSSLLSTMMPENVLSMIIEGEGAYVKIRELLGPQYDAKVKAPDSIRGLYESYVENQKAKKETQEK